MFCSVLKGGKVTGQPQDSTNITWRGRRSVEILGFHQEKKLVDLLFMFFIDNLCDDGTPNYLHVLHPGSFDFELLKPWPAPSHIDEPVFLDDYINVLSSVYNGAFHFDEPNNKLVQTKGLSSWDGWFDFINESVTIWPNQEKDFHNKTIDSYIRKHFPDEHFEIYEPFTTLELGPFTKSGPNLIALKLTLDKQSYENLLGDTPAFSIDGPENLLLRLDRSYIAKMPLDGQDYWKKELKNFDKYLPFGESYDVILIQPPHASETEIIWKEGIVEAPIQPNGNIAKRYITRNHNFCLGLKYVSVTAKLTQE